MKVKREVRGPRVTWLLYAGADESQEGDEARLLPRK
jgi:hypothetical protein